MYKCQILLCLWFILPFLDIAFSVYFPFVYQNFRKKSVILELCTRFRQYKETSRIEISGTSAGTMLAHFWHKFWHFCWHNAGTFLAQVLALLLAQFRHNAGTLLALFLSVYIHTDFKGPSTLGILPGGHGFWFFS